MFFPATTAIGTIQLASAKKTACAFGVVVVCAIAISMLLETSPSKAAATAKASPGGRYSIERKATRKPERRMLERSQDRNGSGLTRSANDLGS